MKKLITSILMLLCITVYAQQAPTQTMAGFWKLKADQLNKPDAATGNPEGKPIAQNIAAGALANPISVQILAGSQGIGTDLKYGFLPKLSGRVGFAVIPVTVNNPFSFSSFATADQLSARFSNVHLLADYSPFSSGRFRIVGGAAYLVKGNADVLITPSGSYQFGNATITKDQIGSLNAEVSWKGVAPYLGVALFGSFPDKFFNMNLDLGTYYLSRPGTSFTGTKMLSDNSAQEPQFNQNMQGYRWLPVIQLNFNFRIK